MAVSLSDHEMGDVLFDITSTRLYSGTALKNSVPDQTTIANLRQLFGPKEIGA